MPLNRYGEGLFKAAPTPDPIPNKFSISDAQSFLRAVANATAKHRVSRTYTDETGLTSAVEGGDRVKVVPAGSQDELESQIARLRLAFEAEEGRPPSERDDDFWQALSALTDAYEGPEIGDIAEVVAPLVGGRS